ncbi:PAS domain S-box protein [Shimia sp. MMG029]|uniref:PAS domain S-box protein n=1 Tax=Shimia sp. MMG029 TaxID=3021978 RepID=UPI0022FECC3D|nr:PAS domain S-box protein [Shimia sp. MMG029]MDA5558168.1 PAS domain S-box protein [Shimia sp. MMG029]
MIGRWPFILLVTLMALSLGLIGLLGRSVIADMRVLSEAQNDDVSWRMSQLEVELLRLQNSVQGVLADPDRDVSEVRKRFDIFYSRITTLQQSRLYQSFRGDPTIDTHLSAATDFLDNTTPLIDGADDELRAALGGIYRNIENLGPNIRGLALSGIENFTSQEALQRETFSRTLTRLVMGIVSLIAVLFIALAILIALYRQGRRISLSSEIARTRFEAAISSSLDAILIVDSSGRIIEFNGAAQDVFGFERSQVLGKDMVQLIVPEHLRFAHTKGMQRFLQTGEKKVIGAGRLRLEALRKSGEIFPVELSISLSQARGEKVFVSYLRDITKEIQAEQKLQEALEKAQLGEKAKSNLLTVMSHEMRTPLNGILGSLELIDQSNMSEQNKQHLNAISVSGDLLLSHVNDVLDFSKLSANSAFTEQSVFDLPTLIDECVKSLSASAQARGNVIAANVRPEDIGFVIGYRRSLQRSIVNLAGNAIKFTRDGSINIEVERLQNQMIELRVSDTGVGIATENLEAIFEEFVTVDTSFDRSANGTGLGLAITKRLVAQMGGEIEADSILGEGSLFVMRLPLPAATQTEVAMPQAPASQGLQLQRKFRALVVDDNKINRDVLGALLTDFGGHIVEASNGYDAIDLAREHKFDVLMLDISMPGIDGIETLRQVRKEQKYSPAIAVTAHASPADHRQILASGFSSLLVKPITRSAVHQCLSGVFDLPLGHKESPANGTVVNEFLDHFGPERFRDASKELLMSLNSLLQRLVTQDDLTQSVREEIHQLSGSAAVLGLTILWEQLQSLQNLPNGVWREEHAEIVTRLHQSLKDVEKDVEELITPT